MQKYLILKVTHLVSDDFAFRSRLYMKIMMSLHSNLAFRYLQCALYKMLKFLQILYDTVCTPQKIPANKVDFRNLCNNLKVTGIR